MLRLALGSPFGRYLVLVFEETPFRNGATPTFRCAGLADITAMKDKPVMGWAEHLFGDAADQLILHGSDGFARGKACTIAEAEDMGIHRHGWLVEGDVEDDISRFPTYAGQGFQRFTVIGYLTVVFFQQLLAEQGHVMGFGPPKPYGADMLGDAILT